jgi:GNAT superfamily N-acetyltransferase
MTLTSRLATQDDLSALRALMDLAIGELQKGFLTEEQIAASRLIMGLDTQLVEDGTYFVVEADGQLAGCGGWSRRATLYGGNQTPGRDAALLDPRTDPARVRAMYTHPAFVRRGVGRLVLQLCEQAAADEGFARLELMATLAGLPLYTSYGFSPVQEVVDDRGGVAVPLVRMTKPVALRPSSPDKGCDGFPTPH